MTSQTDLIPPAEDHDRMRAFEVDRTPFHVAEQGAGLALALMRYEPSRVLLPAAGDGVFAKVLPRGPHIVGVEPRKEDIEALARWVDLPMCMTFAEFVAQWDGERFDLILDNPAFSLLPELLEHAPRLLQPGGLMVLYGLSAWGHSDEPSECGPAWEKWAPSYQHRIYGRVRHRIGHNPNTGRPYGTDSRKYSFWTWVEGKCGLDGSGAWVTQNLPPLTKAERTVESRET